MDLLKRVDALGEDVIRSTQELVKIKSVREEALPGMPFGKGVNDCLEYVLQLSEKLGFTCKNVDGYAAHAEMGQGEEILGILVHLDVVPEGSDWTYPPYAAEIHDGKIFGRGTIDDKGPAMAALYAMKAVLDSGIQLNKRVRLIFGLDEETGVTGINYYLNHEEVPALGFSPDAEFPVIHAEKGITSFVLEQHFKSNTTSTSPVRVKAIKGGNASNMVPDYCEVALEGLGLAEVKKALEEYIDRNQVQLKWEDRDGGAIIKSYGISAHGSLPQLGLNAVSQVLIFLSTVEAIQGEVCDFFKLYAEKIGMEYHGESIGCAIEDEVSGKLTLNVGVIELTEEKVKLIVNVRYPVTSSIEAVYDGIRLALRDTDLNLIEGGDMEPLYVPMDDELVVKLMSVYQELTGDKTKPIAIGGGTYARSIKKAVAFGPLFPGQTELAHQKDEYIGVEELILSTKIYARAIEELAK